MEEPEFDPEELDNEFDISETTDFHGNAAAKADMVEFAWDDFTVKQFDFSEFMAILSNETSLDYLVT